ncbi:thiol:disulfide interchange protein DsbA/DsbL [Denitratimonas sp. CY0512]|uniref:thiol:disulfide interchange protein DsbA/DsbL n=1 Tax=Denitratimonas sp. CY0512 TaxID=3131940 RepID=UPI0030A5F5E8
MISLHRFPSTLGLALGSCLLLAACGGSESPPPEAPAPAVAPSAPAANTKSPAPAETATAPAETTTPVADDKQAADDSTTSDAPATDNAATGDAPAEATVATGPKVVPEGPEPRLGVDYQIIDPPHPLAASPGQVEVAEVFSYTCIHCARLEALTPAWKETLPPQVNFVYAPMSHGAFEPIARGFYAAQAMGVLDQTHAGMFKALAEQQKLGAGRIDDIARLYADLGVDADALKATANSFAVNTQIARGQRALARWAIEGTPTIVVAGKYRVITTSDRGHAGMLQAARWLAQKEIAEMQAAAAP